jgi:hypothetical protein
VLRRVAASPTTGETAENTWREGWRWEGRTSVGEAAEVVAEEGEEGRAGTLTAYLGISVMKENEGYWGGGISIRKKSTSPQPMWLEHITP